MSLDLTPYNFTLSDQSPLFRYLPSRDGPDDYSWSITDPNSALPSASFSSSPVTIISPTTSATTSPTLSPSNTGSTASLTKTGSCGLQSCSTSIPESSTYPGTTPSLPMSSGGYIVAPGMARSPYAARSLPPVLSTSRPRAASDLSPEDYLENRGNEGNGVGQRADPSVLHRQAISNSVIADLSSMLISSGASSHTTNLAGASVQLEWTGTAVFLYGEANASGYTIQIDGVQTASGILAEPNLLFMGTGLAYGPHSLVLTVVLGPVSIYNATITVGLGESNLIVQMRNISTDTVPITESGFVLSGAWTAESATNNSSGIVYPRIVTNTYGATLSFFLNSASAFSILGSVDYNQGTYNVTLSPPSNVGAPQTSQFNASSQLLSLDIIKYLATGLNRTQTYKVEITDDTSEIFDISKIVVYDAVPSYSSTGPVGSGPGSHSSASLEAGVIAGIVIVGTAAFFVIIILLFFVRRYRLKHRRSLPTGTAIPYEKQRIPHAQMHTKPPPLPVLDIRNDQSDRRAVHQEMDEGPPNSIASANTEAISPTYNSTWVRDRSLTQ